MFAYGKILGAINPNIGNPTHASPFTRNP